VIYSDHICLNNDVMLVWKAAR